MKAIAEALGPWVHMIPASISAPHQPRHNGQTTRETLICYFPLIPYQVQIRDSSIAWSHCSFLPESYKRHPILSPLIGKKVLNPCRRYFTEKYCICNVHNQELSPPTWMATTNFTKPFNYSSGCSAIVLGNVLYTLYMNVQCLCLLPYIIMAMCIYADSLQDNVLCDRSHCIILKLNQVDRSISTRSKS